MDLLTAAERIGIPIVILAAVGYGIWKILLWVADNVVKPITASHIALVQSTEKNNDLNAETLNKIAHILEVKADKLDKLDKNSEQILELALKNHDLLKSEA